MKLTAKEQYQEDLKSPYWFAYRKAVFRILGESCNRCGVMVRLQIHHKRYVNGLKPWQYKNPKDIEVLCAGCHRKEHLIPDQPKLGKWRLAGDLASAILIAASAKHPKITGE